MEIVTRMADRERASLLTAAAAGDEIAFRRIIAEHHPGPASPIVVASLA